MQVIYQQTVIPINTLHNTVHVTIINTDTTNCIYVHRVRKFVESICGAGGGIERI